MSQLYWVWRHSLLQRLLLLSTHGFDSDTPEPPKAASDLKQCLKEAHSSSTQLSPVHQALWCPCLSALHVGDSSAARAEGHNVGQAPPGLR